jgi:hypothetical protein
MKGSESFKTMNTAGEVAMFHHAEYKRVGLDNVGFG